MSNEEPVRSVPDELFQQVTAKAGRQLPDALFGPPPVRPARAERDEPIRSVPDELFQRVTARSTRSLPDALFGPVPPPAVVEPEPVDSAADAVESGSGTDVSVSDVTASSSSEDVVGDAVSSIGDGAEAELETGDVASSSAVSESDSAVSGAVDAADVGVISDGVGSEDSRVDLDSVVAQVDSEVAAEGVTADVAGSPDETIHAAVTVAVAGEADPDVHAVAVGESVESAVVADADTDIVEGAAANLAAPQHESLAAAGADALLEQPVAAPQTLESAVRHDESITAPIAEPVLVQESAAPRPVESAAPRPVLLVIADSLAYYGPKGGLPADDPRIWPNMVAAELDWDVELIARIGWTSRDAYWALIGDPRVWASVPRAGAVVFAVGGMDTLPSPLPTALREMIRYIRPPRLRRGVRSSYNWLQPKLSKIGRRVALPPKVSVDYLEQSRNALNHLRPELPVVAVLPSVHACDAYGRVHRGRARAVKALQAWSGRTSVPLVDLGEAVRDDIESGSANPDGIHWGWAGHAAVATAMTKALQEVR
ncbi:diglucosylglycerate octanoyltransferase [Nocardia sp. NPDC058666]|uniref:diglucosylglycerate octanoyltransferase n=1 Tax=Nocardia sp. NPDC058666 TaxID=3346587 RepID=UPI0036634143